MNSPKTTVTLVDKLQAQRDTLPDILDSFGIAPNPDLALGLIKMAEEVYISDLAPDKLVRNVAELILLRCHQIESGQIDEWNFQQGTYAVLRRFNLIALIATELEPLWKFNVAVSDDVLKLREPRQSPPPQPAACANQATLSFLLGELVFFSGVADEVDYRLGTHGERTHLLAEGLRSLCDTLRTTRYEKVRLSYDSIGPGGNRVTKEFELILDIPNGYVLDVLGGVDLKSVDGYPLTPEWIAFAREKLGDYANGPTPGDPEVQRLFNEYLKGKC
jgi:hypothetical protein